MVVVNSISLAICPMVQFQHKYYASAWMSYHRLWRRAFESPRCVCALGCDGMGGGGGGRRSYSVSLFTILFKPDGCVV